MVLLAVNPTNVFVYWEVDGLKRKLICEHFHSNWVNLLFFLQLHDVTDIYFNGHNAHTTRRVQVHADADSWYIHDIQPGRHYLADFGTTTLQGQFFSISRSNVVKTPPERSFRRTEGLNEFAPLRTSTGTGVITVAEQTLIGQEVASAACPVQSLPPYPHEFDGYRVGGRG